MRVTNQSEINDRMLAINLILSQNLHIKMYRSIILHIPLYGCETWLSSLMEEHKQI